MFQLMVKPNDKGKWINLARVPESQRMWAEAGFRLVSPWGSSSWDTVITKEEAKAQVDWLLAIFKRPEVTGMETIESVMNTLKIAGVGIRLEGETIKVQPPEGGMTEELRNLIRTHKPKIVEHLKKPVYIGSNLSVDNAPVSAPWDEALTANYIREARAAYKDMFDVLVEGKDDKWKEAAFSIMVDALAMLAEAVANRTMGVVIEKAGYVAWLCKTVRENLERFRSANPSTGFNQRKAS